MGENVFCISSIQSKSNLIRSIIIILTSIPFNLYSFNLHTLSYMLLHTMHTCMSAFVHSEIEGTRTLELEKSPTVDRNSSSSDIPISAATKTEVPSGKGYLASRKRGLISNTPENREIFLGDLVRDWKVRAENAEERVEELLRSQKGHEEKLDLKISYIEKKMNNITRRNDLVFDREISSASDTGIKVRCWDFRSRLEEQTKPKWASEMIEIEEDTYQNT